MDQKGHTPRENLKQRGNALVVDGESGQRGVNSTRKLGGVNKRFMVKKEVFDWRSARTVSDQTRGESSRHEEKIGKARSSYPLTSAATHLGKVQERSAPEPETKTQRRFYQPR